MTSYNLYVAYHDDLSIHCRVYSMQRHFHRLLRLVANEVASKARDIVGEDPLEDPDGAVANLRLALRVCASFRGCYLDQKEKASTVGNKQQQNGTEPYARYWKIMLITHSF